MSRAASHQRVYQVGIIGHTGRGDYGHGIHLAFERIEHARVVALADPDAAGRQQAAQACGAARTYDDYRRMLANESLDIVCVCPRWADQRLAMVMACIEAGCSVYCEKPFALTLVDADAMADAAARAGVQIAVAHQNVYLRQTQQVRQLVQEGVIGELTSIRAVGKQDHRGGGEDMLVLGTHLLNMMRYFAGDAAWLSAMITVEGRPLTLQDAREPTEPVGTVGGDHVRAFFGFHSGVSGSFESRRDHPAAGRCFGLQLIGDRGRIAMTSTTVAICHDPSAWYPWAEAPTWRDMQLPHDDLHKAGNHRAAVDLLEAIEQQRPPLSSARDAMAVLELIHGCYHSQLRDARMHLPLRDRSHPLACTSVVGDPSGG
jgi:predicted dehydrogenase